jgi:solute carrier family 35 protein F1/2
VGEVLRTKWWFYLLLAIADVEANFLVVKAYQYTTITSVMLLDCFSIPCVMVLLLPSPVASLTAVFPSLTPPRATSHRITSRRTHARTQVLSFVFLKARYEFKHYLGVALCLAGLGALVASDAHYNRDESTLPNRCCYSCWCWWG